jgi:L-fucose isomerase-like protein
MKNNVEINSENCKDNYNEKEINYKNNIDDLKNEILRCSESFSSKEVCVYSFIYLCICFMRLVVDIYLFFVI